MNSHNDWPDLPALESTETNDWSFLLLLAVYGGMMLFFVGSMVWMYTRVGPYVELRGKVVLALAVALSLWFVLRGAFGYCYYKTDSGGLTMRGLIRKRFIPWIEIQQAGLRQTRMKNTLLTLRTGSGTIAVDPRGFGGRSSCADHVLASVWQHLRGIGRADGFELPPGAQSFWQEIADDIPQEADWARSAKVDTIGGFVCIAMFVGMLAPLWIVMDKNPFMILFLALLTLLVASMVRCLFYPELFLRAHSVTLRQDYIEARLLWRTVRIPWSEVSLARWVRTAILIQSTNPRREMLIPYEYGSKESELLILAIIRRLRTAGEPQAVVIPRMLCAEPR